MEEGSSSGEAGGAAYAWRHDRCRRTCGAKFGVVPAQAMTRGRFAPPVARVLPIAFALNLSIESLDLDGRLLHAHQNKDRFENGRNG